jgi:hypothetical protein
MDERMPDGTAAQKRHERDAWSAGRTRRNRGDWPARRSWKTGGKGLTGLVGKRGPKGLRGVQGLRGPIHKDDLSAMVVAHFEAVYQQLSIQAKWIERLQASARRDEHAPSKADLPDALGDNRLAARLARMHHLIDELAREAGDDERLKEACAVFAANWMLRAAPCITS